MDSQRQNAQAKFVGFHQLCDDISPVQTEALDHLVSTDSSEENACFTCSIPPSWRQGRTAYGGLTAGLSLEIARKTFPDLPPLRSVCVNFIGPVGEQPIFTAKLLRRGRNVTSIEVLTYTDKKNVANCIFIFGASRASDLQQSFSAPDASRPEETDDFVPPQFLSALPVFFQNFQTLLIEGERPISGAERGYLRVWSRHQHEMSRQGEASFITLGDVLPPAALPMMKSMGAISSINWMVNIIEEPKTLDGWYQVESSLTAAREGYSSQLMRYWNREGTLIAEGMQSVAIFV